MGERHARPEAGKKPEVGKPYPAWSDMRKEVGHRDANCAPLSPRKSRDWCDLFADEPESKGSNRS